MTDESLALDADKVDQLHLRPLVHQHMAMLTAAGISPAESLAIAAHVCALVYSDEFVDALESAFASLGPPSPPATQGKNSAR